MEIERLFDRNPDVPGMRPSAKRPSGLRPVADAAAGISDVIGRVITDPPADALGESTVVEDAGVVTPEFPVALVDPLKPGSQLVFAHDPAHPHSEKVRLLRTEVLLRHPVQSGVVALAIVSASPGEGRSQLAAELALALSQLGRPTLLMDADMRRPTQHQLFGVELHDGLAQAIERGGSPLLHEVEGFAHLRLLTAGVSPPSPIELLSDGRFEALLHSLGEEFEFIVVDTPPCAKFADGLVVSTLVGHVMTVHRARHTDYQAARGMLRQLDSARAGVLGSVLNRF